VCGILLCLPWHFIIAPFAVLSVEDPNADLLLIWRQLRWHSSRNKGKTSGIAQDQRWRQNMINTSCCTHVAWGLKWRVFVLKKTRYIDIITSCVGNYAIFRWLKFGGYDRQIHLTWTKIESVKIVSPRHRPPLPSRKYFCRSLSRLQGHNGAGRFKSKNSNDTIRNRTRNLPACSAVPQTTAQPHSTTTGTLHEDQYTFLITFRSFLLRMRNISDKYFGQNQNTHFVFNNFF